MGLRDTHHRCQSTATSVSNHSGLAGCGPGLEPDQMVQSGLLPGKQRYPMRSGTGSNRTAVPFHGVIAVMIRFSAMA
jgi:hypothetical protein